MLSLQYVIDRTTKMLGGGKVTVEITEGTWIAIIEEALAVYGVQRPVRRTGTFTVATGTQQYTLIDHQYGRGIIELMPEPYFRPFQVPNELYLSTSPLTSMLDITIGRLWTQERANLLGGEFNWKFDPDTGILHITPEPSSSYEMVYIYSDDPELGEVKLQDKAWFLRYCRALAKGVLAMIRGKHSGVPGQNAQLQLDADALRSANETELERLEEELFSKSRGWATPQFG